MKGSIIFAIGSIILSCCLRLSTAAPITQTVHSVNVFGNTDQLLLTKGVCRPLPRPATELFNDGSESITTYEDSECQQRIEEIAGQDASTELNTIRSVKLN
jgi:hypothetical protein